MLPLAFVSSRRQEVSARILDFRDQMRRAAVSVCSNIAEGNDRQTNRDTVRFLYLAKGSAAELLSHIEIAVSIGYLSTDQAAQLRAAAEELSRMRRGLINARISH
jgi:four helix bundle protein